MEGANPSRTAGSSIYPAVEHMLLAARALGLGATLTTLYLTFEKEVEAVLGLPADVHSYALLPIGYPMGRFAVFLLLISSMRTAGVSRTRTSSGHVKRRSR
jgi:nitroreductase